MRYLLPFLFLGLLLPGCGSEPTLDKDRPEDSLAEVKAPLSEQKRQRFEAAWTTIVGEGMSKSFGQAIASEQNTDQGGSQKDDAGAGGVADAVFDDVHGMTADEVISHADSLSRAKVREGR